MRKKRFFACDRTRGLGLHFSPTCFSLTIITITNDDDDDDDESAHIYQLRGSILSHTFHL